MTKKSRARSIFLSDLVITTIEGQGRFAESYDDVLRRILHLPPREAGRRRTGRFAGTINATGKEG